MISRRLIILVFVFAITPCVNALTFDGIKIEYSAGDANNAKAATVVVDFGLESRAFSYCWDANATGWDALDAIDQAGALEVNAIDYGPGWGMFVNDLSYLTTEKFNYGEGASVGWTYYGSSDGENWSLNPGVSSRSLDDNDWDCWVWTNYDEYWNPVRAPGEEPIPEPATIALLGLTGLLIRRRKG